MDISVETSSVYAVEKRIRLICRVMVLPVYCEKTLLI